MTTTKQSRLKIIVICSAAVSVALILLLTVIRVVSVNVTGIGCYSMIRYRWHVELGDYAKAHLEKKYPPMSPSPGVLFLGIESVSPRFIPETVEPFCVAAGRAYQDMPIEQQFANPTLAYFGYALCNEDELLAFLEEYPKFIESGADFNTDLPAPVGRGSFGSDRFLRLTYDLDDEYGEQVWNIPIMFEIPDYSSGSPVSRHWNGRGIAIHIPGDMDSIEYGTKFPMTPAIIERIGEIKARYAKSN